MVSNFKKVGVIDALPDIKYDEKALSQWLQEQRKFMMTDRQVWMKRQRKYLANWDDYITYNRKGPWDDCANFHIPLTMQVVKAVHARFKAALFSVRPWWQLVPLEKLDRQRMGTIDTMMRWAVQNYVNTHKGIEPVIDDWIWDFCTVGWGVLKRRWEKIQRKSIVIEEIKKNEQEIGNQMKEIEGQYNESGGEEPTEKVQEAVGREVEKLLTYFDGPIIETWPHEDTLFPGAFNDVSDLNQPYLVCTDFRAVEADLEYRKQTEFYNKTNVDAILGRENITPGQTVTDDHDKEAYRELQDRFHGVETVNRQAGVDEYALTEGYFRYDIDDDGVPEELIATWDTSSGKILRLTYLDRVSKSGRRPLHKIDFIRRPRRAYSLGLLELLYPINDELDAMHNMRVDYGTLSNIPFFFFRATSGMKPEKIKLEPGVGHPVDDPNNDIAFPKMHTSTAWGFQEEAGLVQWAERLTSVTAMNMGMPSQRVGASRTASGMAALLNEANVNLDVMLNRLKFGYADLLKGVLGDMQCRLPDDIKVRVIGADGNMEFGRGGEPLFITPSRQDIGGQMDFLILANSANSNRELEKQNAILYSQVLLNPINIQMGIVQPNNVYHIMRNILEKHSVLGLEDFITQPQGVQTPLSMYDEIAAVTQGIVPRIVWHDTHEAKIEGLKQFMTNPEYQNGKVVGTVSPDADEAINIAVGIHSMMLQSIQAQAQAANNSGLQISPTLGARATGMVGETGRSLPQENVAKGQTPEGQTAGGEAGGQ